MSISPYTNVIQSNLIQFICDTTITIKYKQVHEHKVPTGHQGRDSPALTGALRKNATSWHKIQRVELALKTCHSCHSYIAV